MRGEFGRAVAKVRADDLVFLDEFGTNLAMAPAYARAPCGIRAYSAVPFNPGANITLTMGLSLHGVVAPIAVPGATNGDLFRQYVERVLVPELRPGNVVVFDNLPAHKVVGVQEAIEAAGAHVLRLPPYSPDLSPVENCGSKVKTAIRAQSPRTRTDLYDSMGDALRAVTLDDARAWFVHCGYRIRPG
jgi:transposase